MSDDKLPDGVERMTRTHLVLAAADYDGNGVEPITVVEGHGRVWEMWIVSTPGREGGERVEVFANRKDVELQVGPARRRQSTIRRVIVIEMDEGAK